MIHVAFMVGSIFLLAFHFDIQNNTYKFLYPVVVKYQCNYLVLEDMCTNSLEQKSILFARHLYRTLFPFFLRRQSRLCLQECVH